MGISKKNKTIKQSEWYNRLLPEYDLPIVGNLDLRRVIQLREEEYESFNKYRIALNKAALEQNKTDNENDWRKIYDDIIYPELNMLDMKMKQLKSGRLNRIFGTMIVIGTAIVANKYGDFIKPDLFTSAQTLGTSVGATGINYLLDQQSNKKANLHGNDFFFLWKLKQQLCK